MEGGEGFGRGGVDGGAGTAVKVEEEGADGEAANPECRSFVAETIVS